MVTDEVATSGFAGVDQRDCQLEGSKNGDKQTAVPYTIPAVLHFIQHEWVKFELERSQWDVEKAELKAKIAFLLGERKGLENLKNDLTRRIKMLEYALRQERVKTHRLLHGANAAEMDEEEQSAEARLPEAADIPSNLDAVPADQTRAGSYWRQGRLLLKQYLEEIGYSDTILDVKNYRLRSLLGINSELAAQNVNEDNMEEGAGCGPSTSVSLRHGHEQAATTGVDGKNVKQELTSAEEEALAEFRFLPGSDFVDSGREDWKNVDYQALDKKKADYQMELMQKKVSRRIPRVELETMINNLNKADEEATADQQAPPPPRYVNKEAKYAQELDVALGSLGEFSELMALTGPFDDDSDAVASDTAECSRKTWTLRFTLRCHFDCVRTIAFHPVDAMILTGSQDATIKLWNLQKSLSAVVGNGCSPNSACKKPSADLEPVYTFRGHSDAVLCMCMSPTGDYCYSGSLDGTIRCWTMPPLNIEAYDPYDRNIGCEVLRGHTDAVWSVAFHNTDNRLISASADGTLKLWQPGSSGKQLLASYAGDPADCSSPTCVDFMTTDLHQAVASYSSGAAYVYDLEQGKAVLNFHADPMYQMSAINQILSHPTLPITITAHDDRTIRFFDNNTGQLIDSVVAHLDAVTCLSIDPNGLYLLSGSHDDSLRLWNVDTKTCLQETTVHRKKFDESVFAVAFHPSRPLIASAGADGLAKIFM